MKAGTRRGRECDYDREECDCEQVVGIRESKAQLERKARREIMERWFSGAGGEKKKEEVEDTNKEHTKNRN